MDFKNLKLLVCKIRNDYLIDEILAEITELENESIELDSDMSELRDNNHDKESQIDELEEEVEDLKTTIDELEEDLVPEPIEYIIEGSLAKLNQYRDYEILNGDDTLESLLNDIEKELNEVYYGKD